MPVSIEDIPTQPVTKPAEIRGWYAYNWAAEVYSACALSVFIPLVLEELTWSAGRISGTDKPCPPRTESSQEVTCIINFGKAEVTTIAFTLYVTAISVALQAVTFISMGALADFGLTKKLFLKLFAVTGAMASIIFLLVPQGGYGFAAALAIISNVCFGAANVFYNAYLPLLIGNHPEVLAIKNQMTSSSSSYSNSSDIQLKPLGDNNDNQRETQHNADEYLAITARLGNDISSKGFAIGYGAGVLLLIISAVVIWCMGQTTYSKQVAIGLAGFWWLLFATYTWKSLHPRPGPPMPSGNPILFSWKRVFKTIGQCKRLPNAFLNLACFFLYSDASNTITSVAILFGQTTLKLKAVDLIAIAILIPFCALLGNLFWLWLSRRMGWSTKKTLIIILSLLALIPLYGIFAIFLPIFKTKVEIYVIGAFFGMCLGSWSSFARVMMSDLIPEGYENEFFSLYEITNKGSSWVGPLAVGIIDNITHDLRYSFIFILLMIVVPLPLLMRVNPVEGKLEAKRYEHEEKLQRKI